MFWDGEVPDRQLSIGWTLQLTMIIYLGGQLFSQLQKLNFDIRSMA